MVAPVTSKTFPTAETHTFMRLFVNLAKQEGGNGLNCFFRHRDLAGPESNLNRPNKDVLYSHGVFDLSAGIDWFSKKKNRRNRGSSHINHSGLAIQKIV